MTTVELKELVIQVFVREITNRVLDKIAAMDKKVLVVCTGGTLGQKDWTANLVDLAKDGFSYDLLLSKNAGKIFNVKELEKHLTFGKIWREEEEHSGEGIIGIYSRILVPALTINSAAKMAACTPDTLATRVIFSGLMQRQQVIIAVDACCPDNEERRSMGFRPTEFLRDKLSENISSLKKYGARLTTANRLREVTLNLNRKSENTQDNPREERAEMAVCTKKLISRNDVINLPQNSLLTVPANSLITDLARDTARGRCITIKKE